MSTTAPLGVAVIGTGLMGADHVRRIDEVISGARVAAVADPDGDRAAEVAARIEDCAVHTDPHAALAAPGVGAVLIASPGPAHEETLLAALERDLPVLCEKPLTPDAASALRVLAAEQKLGHRRVQVGFMRRYDAEYRRLARLLADRELGRPLMLHCRHRNLSVHPYFTNDMVINDSVSHEFDAARWLLGQEIAAVRVYRPTPASVTETGLSDPQFVVFETTGGVVVDVEIFVNGGFGYQVQAEAVCEHGTARIGEAHGLLTNTAGRWGGEIAPDFLTRFADAYDREVQEWADAARRGEVTGPGAWDGYAAVAACAAGIEAQRTGRRVPVEMAERPAFYGR
ncbi:Gfo/Idh/MocA family protein [Streptomyces marincola]|uniref:Inositol 2-dehydrogenase n=1 Tax=Streptomyces marincola TaxID=2878388 RepID=A0A1W7D0F7_9ACTN|nr:Gfo/Idh/MocA family oxidoreductase [Streptomyces marincola]ARQ70496.1 inositol 2-dehydrogenase [Streptomyces marincola]UCM88269.1 Gfo/Idh/MocA family oxidoreductase [Streptomyces marincola]